jgi:hypothetical protein
MQDTSKNPQGRFTASLRLFDILYLVDRRVVNKRNLPGRC